MRILCKAEKKELRILAKDFCLSGREDVQKIIDTCTSYTDGWKKIMKIYNEVYMR